MGTGTGDDPGSSSAPRRTLGRAVVRAAVTVAVAAAIVAWSVRGTDWAAVGTSLRSADLLLLGGCVAVFAASFGTCDVLAFGVAWRRHLDPTVPWGHVRTLVLGKQLLFATLPLLTKTVPPAYFWRRRGLPLARVVGASELVSAAEMVVVLTVVGGTALFGGAQLGTPATVIVTACWLALLVASWWARRPRAGRPRMAPELLAALRDAGAGELALQLGLRLAHQAVAVACVAALLSGWGAALPPSRLLTFGPLFVLSGTLPISVGGYGGPQGVAVALLAHAWGAMSAPDALAFSLCWSTAVLLTQLATGVVMLPRLTRLVAGPRGSRGPERATKVG